MAVKVVVYFVLFGLCKKYLKASFAEPEMLLEKLGALQDMAAKDTFWE